MTYFRLLYAMDNRGKENFRVDKLPETQITGNNACLYSRSLSETEANTQENESGPVFQRSQRIKSE